MDKNEKISSKRSKNRITIVTKVIERKLIDVEQTYEKVQELKNELDIFLAGHHNGSATTHTTIRPTDDIDINTPIVFGKEMYSFDIESGIKQFIIDVDVPEIELKPYKSEIFVGWSKDAQLNFSSTFLIDDPELYLHPHFIEIVQELINKPEQFTKRALKKLRGVLDKSEKQLRRAIGNTKRLLSNFINLDLRSKLRCIIRSLHISTDDGKDADSDLTGNEIVKEIAKENRFSKLLKHHVEWQTKKTSRRGNYNGSWRSSLIWRAEAA